MKCSELWLQDYIGAANWAATQKTGYPDLLTMGGLEVESRTPIAPPFTQVVIGLVTACEKHPEASRLSVCQVKVNDEVLTIVCGASNVKAGIRVPIALVGATLPGNKEITKAKLRGVESSGMICAADELGLAEESEGILILPDDAPIGESLRNYLKLDDHILELSITPNRGDCLSVLGIARELAALTPFKWQSPSYAEVKPTIKDVLPITIEDADGCPRYLGRVIKNINLKAPTPLTIKLRLERSGIRSINAVVDITNYVLLEMGQPMHAFDLSELVDGIIVRKAKQNETIRLLDESDVTLNADTVLIADKKKPLAIAGIMGGLHSGISDKTTDVFLEVAYFDPATVAKTRQAFGFHTESAHRFERGVDFNLQMNAMEYATALILEICGGKAGPVIQEAKDTIPKRSKITLSISKVSKHLGITLKQDTIVELLSRLNMIVEVEKDNLIVTPPSYRFDINLPEDLVEEIARLHGYQHIPLNIPSGRFTIPKTARLDEVKKIARQTLMNQGLHEIISYSFVEENKQQLLNPASTMRALANPITTTMNVMRTNLWTGLIETVLYNQNRKQERTHFFEIGTVFNEKETTHLAGVMSGNRYPEQWAQKGKQVNFYDIKGQIENLLSILKIKANFIASTHAALHPKQQTMIEVDGTGIGVLGMLHPKLTQQFDLLYPVFLFELFLDHIINFNTKISHAEVSKFPEVRRDIAFVVNKSIPYDQIQDTIKSVAGNLLKEVFIFDVYEGDNIPSNLKSVAFAIILQAMDRTLVDEEVTALIDKIIAVLEETYGAELRR